MKLVVKMSPYEGIYESLHSPPKEEDTPPGRDVNDFISDPTNWFRRKWGFTVYRTSYDGFNSDQVWEALLANIQTQVEAEINRGTESNLDDQSKEILGLFHLDPRSDKKRLAGFNMQQVRDLYLQESTELPEDAKPMNWRPSNVASHVFLLVDDEVVEAAAAALDGSNEQGDQVLWVKCVDADERADNHRNLRVRQVFFGWMRMTTRCLAEMWEHIALFWELRRIAPVMSDDSGRGAQIYDGQHDRVEYSRH